MPKKVLKQIKKEVPMRSVAKPKKKQSFLVMYYSRDGNTKHVANDIVYHTGASVIRVKDENPRKGALGWISAGRDAMQKSLTSISYPSLALDKSDVLIMGSPIWAGKITPAIRTLVKELPLVKEKPIGIYVTHAASEPQEEALNEFELLLTRKGYKVIAKESICAKNKPIIIRRKIQSFCARMMKD
jgi:flavodoxin